MDKQELISKLKREFSDKVVDAFEKIKREDFIEKEFIEQAYEDSPLPISYGQTISQPYTIAFMLELLELKDNLKILEIGSGSGYALSLINEISKNSKIYGIERIKEICDKSKKVLRNNKNIHLFCGDGSKGFKEKAPFDRILISAACSKIPGHLYRQLKNNGIIVASVNHSIFQIKKEKGRIKAKEYEGFIFVPLIEG